MVRTVEILEVGPRDGLQNEPRRLAVPVRAELIGRLVAAGLRRIEVASFVNPKRVPQMADAEELLAACRAWKASATWASSSIARVSIAR